MRSSTRESTVGPPILVLDVRQSLASERVSIGASGQEVVRRLVKLGGKQVMQTAVGSLDLTGEYLAAAR